MEVNLRGIFVCCRAVVPQMRKQGGGKIVNISSGRFWMGSPNRLDYSTSKAGVIGLTRSLATEVGPDNICVNADHAGLHAERHPGRFLRRLCPEERAPRPGASSAATSTPTTWSARSCS